MPCFRRRLRFSLRTLFVLVTITSIPFAWRQLEIRRIERRKALVKWASANNVGWMKMPFRSMWDRTPWYLKDHRDEMLVNFQIPETVQAAAETQEILDLFPEADIYIKPRSRDLELIRKGDDSLRHLNF